ncbi:C-type lectin galactose-binding isoform-like isoform X1 [Xiphophorus maculatus]|uniref:C-type lectin galactose-binding isoform-like n=1 Tax=Xiphophorus maculatus TaxID=8083 RepID=A0A3B5RB57_XIPMA|nr:C-type lectin galactose-binding isoform-like isoform X1 [Xiphophorus maculatus]
MRTILVAVPLMSVLYFACGQNLGLREGIVTFYEIQKPWSEAQASCRENHTDLITIRTETVIQALNGTRGWIGLHRDNNKSHWKWSRRDETATFFNWDENEPSQYEHCVFQRPLTKKWSSVPCNATRVFICYDDVLVLVKENKTWDEALEHCRTLDKVNSYDLATLITPDDHDFARETTLLATTEEVWTGLRYLGDEWFWVGGEPVQYQDIPSCPGVWCGVLEKNSKSLFGIRDCNERRNFFCYLKSKIL